MGNQQDMQGVLQDHFSLKGEYDNQSKQQPTDGDVAGIL